MSHRNGAYCLIRFDQRKSLRKPSLKLGESQPFFPGKKPGEKEVRRSFFERTSVHGMERGTIFFVQPSACPPKPNFFWVHEHPSFFGCDQAKQKNFFFGRQDNCLTKKSVGKQKNRFAIQFFFGSDLLLKKKVAELFFFVVRVLRKWF